MDEKFEYRIEYPDDLVPNLWVCGTHGCKVNLFVPWFTTPICPQCEQKSHWKITKLAYTFESDEVLSVNPEDRRIIKDV